MAEEGWDNAMSQENFKHLLRNTIVMIENDSWKDVLDPSDRWLLLFCKSAMVIAIVYFSIKILIWLGGSHG